jgi:hypothetical protein
LVIQIRDLDRGRAATESGGRLGQRRGVLGEGAGLVRRASGIESSHVAPPRLPPATAPAL